MKKRGIEPYDEMEDVRKRNRGRDDWDECDEDFDDYGSDPYLDDAFSSWEEVNGMFYRR